MSARISFDKPYDLRGDVSPRMITNIDEMLGQLYWTVAQLEGKLSGGQGLLTSQNTSITQESTSYGASSSSPSSVGSSVTNWLTGPWTLDGGSGRSVAALRNDPPAGTYNNFEPSGIATAVLLELEPSGAVILTGLKAPTTDTKRLLLLRNRDSSNSVTLKHANSGSSTRNQFSLPSSTDVVMGPGQSAWMYYDTGRTAWTLAITSHTSGGLGLGQAVSSVRRAITEVEIETVGGLDVELVAAQGADDVVVPVNVTVELNVTTGYTTSPSWSLVYDGDTTNLVAVSATSFTTTGKKTGLFPRAGALSFVHSTFNPTNKGVRLQLSGVPGTAGTGVATAVATIGYLVAQVS